MKKERQRQSRKWLAAVIAALLFSCAACGSQQPGESTPQSASSEGPEKQTTAPATANTTAFEGADSYKTIYRTLKKINRARDMEILEEPAAFAGGLLNGAMASGGSEKSAAAEDTAAAKSAEPAEAEGSYSSTNLQEADVDEADILKTDGDYLYVLRNSGNITIVSASGKDSRAVGTIQKEDPQDSPREMYVSGDTLQLIVSSADSSMKEENEDVYSIDTTYCTKIYTYDIADRAAPKLTGCVSQEGDYFTSRKNGSVLYLFTRFYPEVNTMAQTDDYIPAVNGARLEASSICLPSVSNEPDYLVLSSVDDTAPSETLDEKAIVSAADNCYVSAQNIYIYNTDWTHDHPATQLMKFCYENGRITAVDTVSLNGYINDSFSLNEYEKNLRVVLTETGANGTETNSLCVLGEKLNVLGSISDIAAGETIRSARFLGDTGYFVTFRNMDPLFSVDLSDPKNPVILGKLKVTGFSSYLHFYGENTLLGVGDEIDEKTGEYYGIKLSMFNTADKKNVTEENKLVLKDMYNCSLLQNYKAVMIDPKKNVLGFACDGKYMIFSYDKKKGFKNLFTQTISGGEDYDWEESCSGDNSARGCYVKDAFYLVMSHTIQIYDMTDGYAAIGEVEL